MAADNNAVNKIKADPARHAACRLLHSVLEEGAYTNLGAISLLDHDDLDSRDRAFASALVYGTVSMLPAIDWYLDKLSKRPLEKLEPWTRTVLRMGLWQLIYSSSIPESAAVNESVNLTLVLVHRGAASYVNAVLRSWTRQQIELPSRLEAFKYGLPTFLFGLLKKWYGADQAKMMAENFLVSRPWTSLRVNRLKARRDELVEMWRQDGLEAESGLYLPEAASLKLAGHSIRDLIAWQEGLVTVQDEAAMLASVTAHPQPGNLVYDLCAAPGGKTTHLAELMGNHGDILAIDLQKHRVELIEEQSARLGCKIIRTMSADAADQTLALSLPQADLVIADVPCSGLGLLGRKPEIRLNMTYDKIGELVRLQAAILNNAAAMVRPGGYLLYSTCTINPDENIGQIESFFSIGGNSDLFERTDITSLLPPQLLVADPLVKEQANQGYVQLLPHKHAVDGFFICKLRKKY